ncbi:MAG: hypothetical protein Aurels2KO_09140 [Aureliella sp.]
MSRKRDPSESLGEEPLSNFEQELRRLTPQQADLDLSAIDACIAVATTIPVKHNSTAQWKIASASWLVGLATGLLVAILGGKVLKEKSKVDNVAQESAPDSGTDTSTASATNKLAIEPNGTTAQPGIRSRDWANQTDYLAEFSPANIDSPQQIALASRGLLIGLSISDMAVSIDDGIANPQLPTVSSEPAANLGQLRKQHGLAL